MPGLAIGPDEQLTAAVGAALFDFDRLVHLAISGNSFHSRLSRSRPARFLPARDMMQGATPSAPDSTIRFGASCAPTPIKFASPLVDHSPHCLKKNGTPAAWHWSRRLLIQSG